MADTPLASGTAGQLGWLAMPEAPRSLAPLVERTDELLAAWWRGRDWAALESLVDTWEELIGHPDFAGSDAEFQLACHDRAALALCWKASERSDLEGLERARAHLAVALARQPLWAEDVRYHFGILHYNRALIAGDQGDAHTAIALLRQVLAELPTTDIRLRPRCQDVLARTLLWMHRRDTQSADLDEAISLQSEAIAALAINAPYRGAVAGMLASALRDRFKVTGRMADLDQAIRHLEHDSPPDMFPSMAAFNASLLGILLRERYLRRRDPGDLHRALECHEQAVGLASESSRSHALALNNQGNALLEAFHLENDLTLLERALAALSAAVAATEPDDHFYPSRLNNLANSLSNTYEVTGEVDYLNRAIDLYAQAIAMAPPSDFDLPARHYNMANELRTRHEVSHRRGDRRRAGQHYRLACETGLARAAEWALSAALTWGSWASERGKWKEAAQAYGFGVRAIEQLFVGQANRPDKETWLRQAEGLPARAAFAFVKDRRVGDAVLVLERSRGLLLAEALRQRDLDRAEPSALAMVFAAAGSAPLVYLAAADEGGTALVVDPASRKISAVALPQVTYAAVRRRTLLLLNSYRGRAADPASWLGAVDAVCRWAYDEVLAPVLSRLPHNVDRVTLVPTGQLAMLPLHTAWVAAPGAEGGRRYVIDEIAISYAPTAQVLSGKPDGDFAAPNALVIDEPRPVTAPALSWSRIERAAAIGIAEHATVLAGETATKAAVLAELHGHDMIHFSCHGIGRADIPLDSALLMAHDEALTLRDIIELDTTITPRLVVMSACETYQVGTDLPDEVVSLPTGLLQSGCHSVLATQWSVSSMAAALQTAAFYRRWSQGQHPASALCAVQRWLRRVSNAELAAALRPDRAHEIFGLSADAARPLWMSVRRREPDDLPFAHPTEWAAFTYIGG